jgi:hypothetical protein
MPVYFCCPGRNAPEPWNHGIQVYAAPLELRSTEAAVDVDAEGDAPIRRIRHAEIVLIDDVCIAFGRHWLRVRWPGNHRAGHLHFAGYIAMEEEPNVVEPSLIPPVIRDAAVVKALPWKGTAIDLRQGSSIREVLTCCV